jgi:hypothetical protein
MIPGIIGENRFLNIYQPVERNRDPIVFETDTSGTGKPAYILFADIGPGMNDSTLYQTLFTSEISNSPEHFLKTINENQQTADDTLIIVSIDIVLNSIKTEHLVWVKNSDGTYTVQRNTDFMFAKEETGNCTIRKTARNISNKGIKLLMWSIVDILSAPFQAMALVFYFIMVLISGGPVK